MPERNEEVIERGLGVEIGAALAPAAVVLKPVVTAWAEQHFGDSDTSNDSPPPQPSPED